MIEVEAEGFGVGVGRNISFGSENESEVTQVVVGTELRELVGDVLGSEDVGIVDRYEVGAGEATADVADAGDSGVGCNGRDKGTEAEVALPYFKTKGGVEIGTVSVSSAAKGQSTTSRWMKEMSSISGGKHHVGRI